MAVEIDVLIIFAEQDNQAPGWVTSFRSFLETMLRQVSGEKPNVMLKGEFDSLTSPNLDNAGVLVTIFSKDFVQSQTCLEYITKFSVATKDTSQQINRIFKVFKSPLNAKDQPAELRDLFGYKMFNLDLDSGEVKDFIDYFSHDAERQYWMEMIDLCYDINDTLLYLKAGKSVRNVKEIYGRKTVYLAQTSHDLAVQRSVIHRELQRLGYAVLPSQSLPGNIADLEKLVRADLTESGIAIHLIGSDYGDVPDGSEKSVQELQHRLASERGADAAEKKEDFPRLIWITPDLSRAGERQKRFIELLKRDVETSEGAEILQTQLEDFKTIIREELEEASEKKMLTEATGQTVYFMHDKVDDVAVKPYIDAILSAGFNLLVPDFEGDLLELRQKHIENLRNLDAAIIFKGKVNDQWVHMKVLDLLKAPGFGRKKPILGKALIAASGPVANKDPYKSQNLRVIDGDQQHAIASVRSFLQEFKI
jgi:hypothetical protein